MSFHRIEPSEYPFKCILLIDRYIVRQICAISGYDEEFIIHPA